MIGWLVLAALAAVGLAGGGTFPTTAPEPELPEPWQDHLARARREEAERERRRRHRRELAARRAAERAKAEKALEAHRQAVADERQRRFNLVRDALVWVQHLAPQSEVYVEANWSDVLRDRDGMMRRFHDQSSPIATADRCADTATWFLAEFPSEACYLVAEPERNAEAVARKLRAYHGREVELMLPRAMAIGCQRLIEPAQAAPRPTDPALDEIRALLPAGMSEAEKADIEYAVGRENFVDDDARVLAAHRKHREQRGDPPEKIDPGLKRLGLNLEAIHHQHATRKKLL